MSSGHYLEYNHVLGFCVLIIICVLVCPLSCALESCHYLLPDNCWHLTILRMGPIVIFMFHGTILAPSVDYAQGLLPDAKPCSLGQCSK